MSRPVKTFPSAITRLGAALDNVAVEYQGRGRWLIETDAATPIDLSSAKALGFLADLAWRQGLDPAPINFVGRAPSRGVAAWQADAINWLAGRGSTHRRTDR